MNWTTASWVLFSLAFVWPAIIFSLRLRQCWRRRRGLCVVCTYDLREATTERCSECGHVSTRRAPRLRRRAWLACASLSLALFTTSHLAARATAIQGRGWIAAIPTTVLIAYLLQCDRPGTASDSEAAHELLMHRARTAPTRGQSVALSGGVWGPDIPLTRWQWWWLIDAGLNTDFRVGTIASSTAEIALENGLDCGAGSPDQRSRMYRKLFPAELSEP